MLPVLFYLNIFSLLFFFLISLHGRATTRTITTATESEVNLLETKDEKEHPLTSPGFSWAGMLLHLFRNHTAMSTAVFLAPRQEVPASLWLMCSLRIQACLHPSRGTWPVLSCFNSPNPSLSHKKEGCHLRSLLEPPDELRVPPRQQALDWTRASIVTLS